MKHCQLLSRTLKAIIGDEHLIKQTKIPPEHPHSSTIDDVECFFLYFEGYGWQRFYLQRGMTIYGFVTLSCIRYDNHGCFTAYVWLEERH